MTAEALLLEDLPSRTAEQRLQALVENTFDTIAILDARGRIMYEGPSTLRVLGYDPQERHAGSAFEHIHPDDLERAHAHMRALAEGRTRHLRTEVRVLHKDGRYRLLEASATSLLDDPTVRGIVVVARDITDQRAIELERARLLDSERQARASVERALEQLLSLQSVAELFATVVTPEGVAAVAVDRGVAAVGAVGGTVGMLTPSGESIDLYRSRSDARGRRRWRRVAADGPLLIAEAIRARESVWIDSVATWSACFGHIKRPRSLRAAAALPLIVDGQVIGALALHFDKERPFGETERLFAWLLARQCSQAFERVQLYQERAEREQRLQELVRRLLTGQEEERRRIAYELHDSLAQVATGAHQHLQALASRYPPESAEARLELQRALELAQRTVREARSLIHGLRPTVLDDFGLVRAIGVEIESLQAEGCRVRFDGTLGDERLPQSVETALYRVVQEGLTNIRKHAGACRVLVSVGRRGQNVRLIVRDWGRGFCLAESRRGVARGMHVGLEGIQERINLLGGRFAIRSRPGLGTTIEVTVPISATRGSA